MAQEVLGLCTFGLPSVFSFFFDSASQIFILCLLGLSFSLS